MPITCWRLTCWWLGLTAAGRQGVVPGAGARAGSVRRIVEQVARPGAPRGQWGMLGPVSDDGLLAGQLRYYRRRAEEYDRTAFGDVEAARRRITGIVADLRPSGDVLELACGTGMWTQALLRWADTLTAVGAAPVRHGVLRVLAVPRAAAAVRRVLGAVTRLGGAGRPGAVRRRDPRRGR